MDKKADDFEQDENDDKRHQRCEQPDQGGILNSDVREQRFEQISQHSGE